MPYGEPDQVFFLPKHDSVVPRQTIAYVPSDSVATAIRWLGDTRLCAAKGTVLHTEPLGLPGVNDFAGVLASAENAAARNRGLGWSNRSWGHLSKVPPPVAALGHGALGRRGNQRKPRNGS